MKLVSVAGEGYRPPAPGAYSRALVRVPLADFAPAPLMHHGLAALMSDWKAATAIHSPRLCSTLALATDVTPKLSLQRSSAGHDGNLPFTLTTLALST